MIEIANSVLIMETYFSCDIKMHEYWPVCSWNIWEFIFMGLDTRDTYTNSIINKFFLNESYQMTYAVKTVEN